MAAFVASAIFTATSTAIFSALSAITDDVLRSEIDAVIAPGGFELRRTSALFSFLTIESCFRLRALIVEHAASAARSQAALGAVAAYITGVEPLDCPQYEGNAINTAIDRWLVDVQKAAKRVRKRLAIKAGEDEKSKFFGLAKLNAIMHQLGHEEDIKAMRMRCYATSRTTSSGQPALPLPPALEKDFISAGACMRCFGAQSFTTSTLSFTHSSLMRVPFDSHHLSVRGTASLSSTVPSTVPDAAMAMPQRPPRVLQATAGLVAGSHPTIMEDQRFAQALQDEELNTGRQTRQQRRDVQNQELSPAPAISLGGRPGVASVPVQVYAVFIFSSVSPVMISRL